MGTNDKPSSGMDVFADFLVGNKDGVFKSQDDDIDNKFQDINPDDLDDKLNSDKDDDKKDNDDKDKKDNDTKKDDNKGDDLDDNKKDDDKKNDTKKDNDDDDNDEYESEISTFFANQLIEKLGISIEEDNDLKVDKIEDVIELMSDIIKDNSKPVYSSEEVEIYDEFVRNGGNLRDFYKDVYAGRVDIENVDIENVHDQQAIIRENLLNQGYKEERIKRMLSRYEENETLKEEAEDALDLIKEYNTKKADSLLVEQKNKARDAEKAQQKFYSDVNTTIKTMSDVRGIPLTDKDKREVLRYAFVPEDDGITKFQKESKDVRNILELAFLLMNKDKKIDNANKKDISNAYKTLRDKLKAKGNKIDNDQKGENFGNSSLGDFGKGLIF